MVVGIHKTDIVFSNTWLFKRRQKKVFKHVDIFAFRSESIKKYFFNSFKGFLSTRNFIANSGVPEQIILKDKEKSLTTVKRILYVGTLIDRKNADKLLIALSKVKEPYQLTIIGEGYNKNKLIELCELLGIKENVQFLGRIKRESVFLEMEKHDFFVLPSVKETFGLVYLEAMAKGLIVIGMKGWGIDGVVVDGENGFLCKDDSQEKISQKVIQVLNLTYQEQQLIVENSLRSIKKYTDKNVANKYLENISSTLRS